MTQNLFSSFAPVIRGLTTAEMHDPSKVRSKLRIAGDANLEVCYAPFDHVNVAAKLVVVGITPGWVQMLNAVSEARRQLTAGADPMAALRAAKITGAFSGPIRPRLIELLDAIGLPRFLQVRSCVDLFGERSDLIHTTSVLRNPVFVGGENYSGKPDMLKHPLLQRQVLDHFAKDVQFLPGALFVPLGETVAEALRWLASEGVVEPHRILAGLPHPSGANSERIAYFLGKKSRSALSAKTNPDRLDRSRTQLIEQVGRQADDLRLLQRGSEMSTPGQSRPTTFPV